MTTHNITVHKWTAAEIEIMTACYALVGPAGIQAKFPDLTRDQIMAKANRLGLKYKHKPAKVAAVDVTCSRPGAPTLYQPQWEPLKPRQGLPVRSGGYDFRRVPSLVPGDDVFPLS